MKTIFYGVNGEGLGHVSRTLAVVEALPDCEVHIFTFGKALDFLLDIGYPFAHEIEGVMFKYRGSQVSYFKTSFSASWFFTVSMKRNVKRIRELAQVLKPDLYITDFEPSVARAAKGNTLVSIDNQHRFVYCNMSGLPLGLRAYAGAVSLWTQNLVPNPNYVIVTTFHYDWVKKNRKNIHLVEGMVRKAVEETPVSNKGHITVYLRKSVSDGVLKALQPIRREFHVYGAVESEVMEECGDNFYFFPLSPKFVQDVASCDRIIGTAGHQLLTESRFFGKSMLAIPEPGQYEQYINTHYAEATGFAERCHLRDLSTETIETFLNKTLIHSEVLNGVHKVKDIVESLL
jgi:uncharacterized protein (TIGR00661 family)